MEKFNFNPVEKSKEEEPKKENQSLKELAEKELGWLKEKLSEDDYQKAIEQKVADLELDDENLEFANQNLEENLEKNKKAKELFSKTKALLKDKILELRSAKIDVMTNLKTRKYFFSEAIPKELSKILGENVKNISDQEWLEILKDDQKSEELEKIDLTIAMIDLSYLSLANRDGHASGDALLSELGKTVAEDKDVKKYGHRYGGDEFTFLFKDIEEARDKMEKLENSFSNLSEVSNLANYGLKPNLDVGTASFFEGVKVFRSLLKNETARDFFEKNKAFNELNNIWLMLADKRSFLIKAQKRIPFLMKRYQEGYDLDGTVKNQEKARHYDLLVKYLGKGAYEIEKSQIAELIKKSDGDVYKRDELVWEFIKEVEKKKLPKDEEYDSLRDIAIAKEVGVIEK